MRKSCADGWYSNSPPALGGLSSSRSMHVQVETATVVTISTDVSARGLERLENLDSGVVLKYIDLLTSYYFGYYFTNTLPNL